MSVCPACGKIFSCGMVDDAAETLCWCTALPPLPAEALDPTNVSKDARCFCPDCLRKHIAASAER